MRKRLSIILIIALLTVSGCSVSRSINVNEVNSTGAKPSVNGVNSTMAKPNELRTSQIQNSIGAKENEYVNQREVLYSTCFISPQIGYISFENTSLKNILARTMDGGQTWQQVYSGKALRALSFATEQIGYAVDYPGEEIDQKPELLRTVNGGVDWKKVDFVGSIPIEIDCISDKTIFVAASRSSNGVSGGLKYEEFVLLTTDGAKTWKAVSVPEGFYGEGMSWVSLEEGYLIDTDQPWTGSQPKRIYKTTDTGKTWTKIAESGLREDNGVLPIGGYPNGIKFLKMEQATLAFQEVIL